MVRSLVVAALLFSFTSVQAQDKTAPSDADTVIVFTSPRPLLEDEQSVADNLSNSLGLSFSFSDFGIGAGFYYGHRLSQSINAVLSLDASQAKGAKEFGFLSENKVNRIYLLPIIASIQYRILENSLGENMRPFLTAGAGPVMVLAMPASKSFFSGFGEATTDFVPGGFVGVGTTFGSEKKSQFGVNVRYYIIPYPKGIQSLDSETLTDFNALFLTITYGYNF
jgi:hypothetical protein